MATKRTEPRPVTLDIDGFPGAGVYRTAPGEYWPLYLGKIVGGQMFSTAAEAEGPAIAAWVQAHPECQVTAEIVPDPETWQAVSAEYTGNSTGGLDGGADIDPDALYCEVCGCGITAEDAVQDGEQMVCPECAEIAAGVADALAEWRAQADAEDAARAAAEEAAYGAYVKAHGHDPAEWGKAPAGAVSSVARVEIFDQLCQAYDELCDYWRDVPRRLKSLREAWEVVLLAEHFYFDQHGNLLVESDSAPGVYHAVGHTCPCTAGRWGGHCRHSRIADIIGRARRLGRSVHATAA